MDKLIAGARELGIELTLAQRQQFEQYYNLLLEWNRRMNLTRILEYEKVQALHFLDSLSVVLGLEDRTIPPGTKVIDVGTGAGFPGLPLKIAFPQIRLWLNESTRKKALFLTAVIENLDLEGVELAIGRAEELGRQTEYRGQFDLVLARALAEMAALAELCLPFCRLGGRFIAQKKGDLSAELEKAGTAIKLLGGGAPELVRVGLGGLGDDRCLVVIEKVAETPPGYPRRPGMPEKRPLGIRRLEDSPDCHCHENSLQSPLRHPVLSFQRRLESRGFGDVDSRLRGNDSCSVFIVSGVNAN